MRNQIIKTHPCGSFREVSILFWWKCCKEKRNFFVVLTDELFSVKKWRKKLTEYECKWILCFQQISTRILLFDNLLCRKCDQVNIYVTRRKIETNRTKVNDVWRCKDTEAMIEYKRKGKRKAMCMCEALANQMPLCKRPLQMCVSLSVYSYWVCLVDVSDVWVWLKYKQKTLSWMMGSWVVKPYWRRGGDKVGRTKNGITNRAEKKRKK